MEPWNDPDLVESYLKTRFEVNEPRLTLWIGQMHPEADQFLADHGKSTWAFLTAHNPASVLLTPQNNEHRNFALLDMLEDMELTYYRGQGVGCSDDWPAEISFWVLDISLEDSIRLSKRFGQNSFVYGKINEPAEMIWTLKPL